MNERRNWQMEARIQQKIDDHLMTFKTCLRDWMVQKGAIVMGNNGKENITSAFLQFMFDNENLQLQKEDFQRRKRVKNHVPMTERCCAKRASGDQCTRRRLEGLFCGTHSKGSPHGVVDQNDNIANHAMEKVEIWLQVIQGISYYIDKENRVYCPEDIVANNTNPRVIGKWESSMNTHGEPVYRLILAN